MLLFCVVKFYWYGSGENEKAQRHFGYLFDRLKTTATFHSTGAGRWFTQLKRKVANIYFFFKLLGGIKLLHRGRLFKFHICRVNVILAYIALFMLCSH